jgi:hypothetical protein
MGPALRVFPAPVAIAMPEDGSRRAAVSRQRLSGGLEAAASGVVTDDVRYLCIQCWRIVERADAECVCGACEGATGVPWLPASSPLARPRLRDLPRRSRGGILSETEGEPECPNHPGMRMKLACPCGHLLSPGSRFEGLEPAGLGFAGPVSAGKTVLITTMVGALQGLDLQGEIEAALLGIDDTDERFAKLLKGLQKGEKPSGTVEEGEDEPPGSPPRNFCWEILASSADGSRRGRLGMLAVYDLAGETWTVGPAADERHLDSFLRYLRLLRSLVFVIDGAVIAADLGLDVEDAWSSPPVGDRGGADMTLLRRVSDRLGESCREVDLALVVSKMDLFWDDPRWRGLGPDSYEGLDEGQRRELVEDLLGRSYRRRLLVSARGKFRQVEVFATSGLGFRPTPEMVVDNRLKVPPKPIGVREPLRWLLGRRLRS